MRIGIITLSLHFNYGGILQAYALQVALRNLGHEPINIVRLSVLEKSFGHFFMK